MMMTSRAQFIISWPFLQSLRCFHKRSTQGTINGHEMTTLLLEQLPQFKGSKMYCQKSTSASSSQNISIAERAESEQSQLTLGEKVKQTTKDASYLGVIIAGVGVTGIMFYAILRELFSGRSPNSVYTEALKICKNDVQVANSLGEPIKGYGEINSRGRRRHVSHMEYIKDDINYMRMKFYVEGSRRKGTVHLEVKENTDGKYEYRYLFVELNGYPAQTFVLTDNRHLESV